MDWPSQMCLKVMQGFEILKTWVDEVLGVSMLNVSIKKIKLDEKWDLVQDVVLHLS
jgi:hypothetical protein